MALARIPAIEVSLFAWVAHRQAESHDVEFCDPSTSKAEAWGQAAETPLQSNADVLGADLKFGRMFEAALNEDLISKFSRYETNLSKELRLTLDELRRLSANRLEGRLEYEDD